MVGNTGIYALTFNDDSLVYIGQSIDIDLRVSNHLSALRNDRHYNYKLTEAYKTYGTPKVVILQLCSSKELDYLENMYITEFNACVEGLNIRSEKEQILRGPHANSAKYSKEQILEVFSLLCANELSRKEIELVTGVPIGNINVIARGASHAWLGEEFPEKYQEMLSIKGCSAGVQNSLFARKGLTHPILVSPDGLEYEGITNLRKFCTQHGIRYDTMYKVTKGIGSSCCGWTIKKGQH